MIKGENAVPYQYTNRKQQTVYLHQGKAKSGAATYFFSQKCEGSLVDALPEGYEVYEHPNAQVFLRKVQPRIITDRELGVVRKAMERHSGVKHFQVDVKKKTIIVYTSDEDADAIASLFQGALPAVRRDLTGLFEKFVTYSPMLRFQLIDEATREFVVERYCFRGSIDDWINVGGPGRLADLAREFVSHLGKDSYFELF